MTGHPEPALTGYRRGPSWLESVALPADTPEPVALAIAEMCQIADPVPHVEIHVPDSPWPWLLRQSEIAAALHASTHRLDGDTDLDDLAHAVVLGVHRAGLDTIRYAQVATADIAPRLLPDTDPADIEPADMEDVLIFIEVWGERERYLACAHAAALLCRYAPPMLRTLPGHGHCPTLSELADPIGQYTSDDHPWWNRDDNGEAA